MRLRLDKGLITNIKQIDDEHLRIFIEYNELNELANKMHIDTYFSILINFIENYIEVHFKNEEALQVLSDYPNRIKHKIYHDKFKLEILKYIERYKKDDIDLEDIKIIHDFIGKWVNNHIKVEDVDFGIYYNSRLKDGGEV